MQDTTLCNQPYAGGDGAASRAPEVNIDELMERIRQEVARRKTPETLPAPAAALAKSVTNGSVVTHVGNGTSGHSSLDGRPAIDWLTISAHRQDAEHYAIIANGPPELKRFGFFKRQISRFMANAVLYLSRFLTNRQTTFNLCLVNWLRELTKGLKAAEQNQQRDTQQVEGAVRRQEAALQVQQNNLNGFQGRLNEQQVTLRKYQGTLQQQQALFQEYEAALRERQSLFQKHDAVLLQQQTAIDEQRKTMDQHFGTVMEQQMEHQSLLQTAQMVLQAQDARVKSLEKSAGDLKSALRIQEQRITMLLEEARRRLPAPFDTDQLTALANEEGHGLDSLYLAFEDQFRGSREDIKERLKVHLPSIRQAGAGTETAVIVDLGCGRGEWLELLREEGLQARGVDINRVFIAQCRQRGLDVTEGDALAHLRGLPDGSVGAITGFHIIEHLPFDVLIKLLDETVRVLKPGGVAIYETPNPQNMLVGAYSFYLDPTHQHPLPSPMMRFFAEARGLCRVEILDLHPYPELMRVATNDAANGSDVGDRFNSYFYGPQDYAVIGWKA